LLLPPHPLRDWLFLGSLKDFGDGLLENKQLLTWLDYSAYKLISKVSFLISSPYAEFLLLTNPYTEFFLL
jgi:hypothetical protein